MNRVEQFNKILAGRREIAGKVSGTINRLVHTNDALCSCVDFLKKIAAQRKDSVDDDRKKMSDRFQEQGNKFLERIRSAIHEMRQIEARFGRSTVNIGVTGNAGIGKSTLLQKLTGLPNDIIPARDSNNPMGGSCTGAPSIIINNIDNDKVYANVEFYQEADFFEEIIKPYYQSLNQIWLPMPASFNDFMSQPLPSLPDDCEQDTRIRNLYDALMYRHVSAKDYCHNFGRTISHEENTEIIRRFVAQKDINNSPVPDWIPVKIVTIFCPFMGIDGERISDPLSVCDTPGLGDIGCKADDSLMRNIAENVDAVWTMNMVTSNSQIVKQTDSDLYMLIRNAVPEWQPQEWVYGVINRYAGVTPQQVDEFCKEMQKRHLVLRKVFELDVRDRTDVVETFEATLDDIAENQRFLDEKLYQNRADKVEQLLSALRQFAERELKLFLKEYESGMMDVNTAKERFYNEVWDALRNSLTDLRDEYEQRSQEKNKELECRVRELSNKKDDPAFLVKPIPTIAVEIKSDPTAWIKDEMDRIRVALGKEIGEMTGANLVSLFENLRKEVREVFLEQGQLRSILPDSDSSSDAAGDWLDVLADRIMQVPTPKKEILEDIAKEIKMFQKATLSYEQLLEPRIIQYGCLDILNPNGEGKSLLDLFEPKKAKEENKEAENEAERFPGAFYAQDTLRSQIQEALEKACKRINELYEVDGVPHCILIEPSASLYSAIEKFYLILFADKGSCRKWEEFYVNYKDEIWSNDSKRIPQSLVRQWNVCVNALLAGIDNKTGNRE